MMSIMLWIKKITALNNALFLCIALTACGLHPRGETTLPPALHYVYIETTDPYGYLANTLEQYFTLSKAIVVRSKEKATAVLNILQDETSQVLLSVSSTQQTRQYNLITTITFSVTDPKGKILLSPYTLSDSRTLTVQSDQVLGASNETILFYKLMKRTLAYAIINYLASDNSRQALAHVD